ncbi:MAG: TetR/AcrR family transcriptional regulator [Peptococcaceae bacterium]|jgi:AcrR family transcriptional regulator|nr:TetR/AcrR family transcriptional regulator [Peptococcaceae bacterium]
MNDLSEHKIMQIDEEKRSRILNAAISEFTKGYKQASTDVIVREAGISKGLLFHYFGTKRDLFLFLFVYAVQTVSTELLGLLNPQEKDLLARWRQQVFLRVDLCRTYPAIFEFIAATCHADIHEIAPDLQAYYNSFAETFWPKLFEGLDTSLFRPDIPAEKICEIIFIFIQGYHHKHLGFKDCTLEFDEMVQEIDAYILILRKCFYR